MTSAHYKALWSWLIAYIAVNCCLAVMMNGSCLSESSSASALHVYHTCVTTLQRELGVDPDLATRTIYERLLQQETPSEQAIIHQPLLAAPPTLIGRKQEWEALQAVWQAASSGEPRFVLVTGEAGMGKSRLAEDFLQWASQQGAVTAKVRSYAAEGQLSLAPVTEWLRSDGLRAPLRHLDAVWLSEVVRLLPELLAEQPALPHYASVTEYGQRFFEALARAILVVPQPIVLLLDDLQWCDQETLEWVHLLLRFDHTARLLVVGCVRAEELPPQHPLHTLLLHLRSSTRVTELPLAPLDAAETAKLASQVAKRELELDEGLQLYHETEGYPLFVVEMVRADLGRGTARPPEADPPQQQSSREEVRTLPPRVYAVLAGRLLHLSASARELVVLAATIGRAFSLDLLSAGGLTDIENTIGALDELWHKRIIREHGANSYDFTHDKLREVAYAEISAPQRRMLHQRVAHALEAMHAGDLDAVKMVQDLDQPFNEALVSAYLAMLQQLCADEAVALVHAEHALALASKYQAPYYRAWAANLVCYSLALKQPDEERIGKLCDSIAEFKTSSARLRMPYFLSLLAHVCEKAGRVEEGLACIDEALAEARTHNERWWDAELHRLRGELLLMHGAETSDVEAALLRAISIARSQQARSLELRATMSLARLWIAQNRSDDARRQLSDLCAWFTEGFETPDLQAARLLLAQL
jgi:hypothetical protein